MPNPFLSEKSLLVKEENDHIPPSALNPGVFVAKLKGIALECHGTLVYLWHDQHPKINWPELLRPGRGYPLLGTLPRMKHRSFSEDLADWSFVSAFLFES